jgi:hypothetical protein
LRPMAAEVCAINASSVAWAAGVIATERTTNGGASSAGRRGVGVDDKIAGQGRFANAAFRIGNRDHLAVGMSHNSLVDRAPHRRARGDRGGLSLYWPG